MATAGRKAIRRVDTGYDPAPAPAPTSTATTTTTLRLTASMPDESSTTLTDKKVDAVTDVVARDVASIIDAEQQPPSSDRKELEIQDQSARLPMRKILIIYLGIGLALVISFMDQSSVSTAAPAIGTDLGGSASIAWVGTAFFVSNCALQLLYGRLSDIFGRKAMLQIAVLLLALGDLLCSFAKSPIELYIFRAIGGTGGGGINNIAMVIVSDIIPLKERGKYQGFISASTSIGNAIGPFIGGGLASAGQWRWLFRLTAIMGVAVIFFNHFILPPSLVTGSIKDKLSKVDYWGILFSAAFTVLLLVPISGGGSTFAWASATVIATLILGVLCGIVFVAIEWKFTSLPILPLRLFRDQTTAVVMGQSFLIGMILFGNIFEVPVYLQYVKGYSSIISGGFILAYSLPGALWGILSGIYTSNTNHYKRVIIVGAVVWTVGLGLQILWDQHSSMGLVIGALQLSTIGVGFSLQTTLVAALATTANADRAVVTAGRNFFRTMGGAFGLAVANSIYQSVVAKKLAGIPDLTVTQREALLNSSLGEIDTLPAQLVSDVRDAYAQGLKMVFISYTVIAAATVVSSFFIKEVTFRKDSPELEAAGRRARGLMEDPEKAEGFTATTPDKEEEQDKGDDGVQIYERDGVPGTLDSETSTQVNGLDYALQEMDEKRDSLAP